MESLKRQGDPLSPQGTHLEEGWLLGGWSRGGAPSSSSGRKLPPLPNLLVLTTGGLQVGSFKCAGDPKSQEIKWGRGGEEF